MLQLHNFILYNFIHMAKLSHVFILHCWSMDSLAHLATLAQSKNVFTQFQPLDSSLHFNDNFLNHNILKLGVFLDINCNQSDVVLKMASAKRLYSHRYHWLIYDSTMDFSQIETHFKEAQLFVDTDLTYVTHDPNTENFILYDLHNKGRQLGAKLNITADREINCNERECRVKRYLSDLHTRNLLQHRKSFTGLTMRATAVVTALPLNSSIEKIFEFMEAKDRLYLDTYGRLGYQARQPLRDMLDCKFKYIFRDRWSDGNATGGMIGDLILDVADLAIAPFIYSFDRGIFLQPLTKFSVFREMCMFRNPRSVSAGLSATEFLQPFSGGVWLTF
uniref:Uncharacterized protein LOC108046711 n=1 Tax=Drosophila rhopaloa TaxID=1041015 RepID=A0A6P4F9E5_DRORH